MLITCPSGLSFHARKWRIGDRRNLHDQKVIKQGLLMRKMLEAVDEGIESSGPYDFLPGKKIPWAKVYLGDIIDALIQIRIATRPLLDYTENCENCGAQIPLSIDLRKLDRTPMSDEGKFHLSNEDPIIRNVALMEPTEEGVPQVQVKIRLLRGEDMPVLTKHYKQDPTTMQEAQMVLHIKELTTPDGDILDTFFQIQQYYAAQDWYFSQKLDEVIAEIGGGVVTLVNMDCRRCNAEQQGIVPFGAEFFYPQTKRNISSMATL